MDSLQLLLVGGLIVMALINTASLIWAFYLDHRLRGRPTPKIYDVHMEGTKVFPELELSKVADKAKAEFEAAVTDASQKLHGTLDQVSAQVGAQASQSIQNSLAQELEKYQVNLETLRNQTMKDFASLQQDLTNRRTELLSHLDTEAAKVQQAQLDTFNAKLGDVVSSYIVEALGSQIDMSAQTKAIIASLEQHKEDIKRDILA
jgi:F0F1-type ATP synthase membrane subunit b/b'